MQNNKPEQIDQLMSYLSSRDIERKNRWTQASQTLEVFDKGMMIALQGLGNIDSVLVVEDQNISEGKESNPFGDIGDHLTQSYLWTLGIYEIIRTIDFRLRNEPEIFAEFQNEIKELKRRLERIRIPLAKFEPSRRHKETDFSFPIPGFNQEYGVSWMVAPDVWVRRRSLSDEALDILERMNA